MTVLFQQEFACLYAAVFPVQACLHRVNRHKRRFNQTTLRLRLRKICLNERCKPKKPLFRVIYVALIQLTALHTLFQTAFIRIDPNNLLSLSE